MGRYGICSMGDAIAALQNADFNAEVVNDSENADNAASNAQQWGQKVEDKPAKSSARKFRITGR